MGLITKEVEVELSSNTIKYYENLGYKIPRIRNKWRKYTVPRGTKIRVKVKDLKYNSKTIVDVECDNCKKKYQIQYQSYSTRNDNGKITCHHCSRSVLNTGENNPLYKKDKSEEERIKERRYPEYIDFVKRVIARDNHICQCCGKQVNHDAEVHHLDGYDWCKEKRTDETNGVCLCSVCHKAFHSIYKYGNNSKEQYEEWIGYAIGELKKYNGKLPTTRKVYCYEENKIYDGVYAFCRENNCSDNSTIYKCCDLSNTSVLSYKGKHFFWLDEYEKLNKKEIDIFLELSKSKGHKRKIICITNGSIYYSISEASRITNASMDGIRNSCKDKKRYSGKLPDGTPLQWMYYEDFLKLPIEEQNEILARNQESSTDDSFIM